MASSDKEPNGWLTLALGIGLFTLRDLAARRRLMFYLTISAMGQLAIGMLILNQLSESLIVFCFFWGFCMLQVCLMMLLALYDMLAIRQDQRAKLTKLRDTMFSEEQETETHADDSEKPGKT